MIDLFFFCSHQFLMISWFDFSIMMPYYLWTLFPWPFENVHFILNIQLIKVFYGWQSVNGIVIQSSITLLHTRHTGPGSRTADRVITATLTQHNRFRFTFFADTRGPPRLANTLSKYIFAHTRVRAGGHKVHVWPMPAVGRLADGKEWRKSSTLPVSAFCLLPAAQHTSSSFAQIFCSNIWLWLVDMLCLANDRPGLC